SDIGAADGAAPAWERQRSGWQHVRDRGGEVHGARGGRKAGVADDRGSARDTLAGTKSASQNNRLNANESPVSKELLVPPLGIAVTRKASNDFPTAELVRDFVFYTADFDLQEAAR